MAIYRLSDSKPTTVLLSDDNERIGFGIASVLAQNNVPFSIVAEQISGVLGYFADHIITNTQDLPAVPQVIVDCRWLPEEESPLDFVLQMYPNTPILSVSPCLTATRLQAQYETEAAVVRFNALPGLFPLMKRLEIAPALNTKPEALLYLERYVQSLGFETEVIQDIVGFVTPRIVAMLVNEAAFAVMENVASPHDIDNAMKLGVNYPYGPLEWADMIGLDLVVEILDALYDEYGQERYRACVLLRRYVDAGWLGMIAGRGFYSYGENGKKLATKH